MTGRAGRRARKFLVLGLGAALVIVLHSSYAWALRDAHVPSGYLLLGLVLLLALYNVRKKLTSLPLGRSSSWLQLHVYAGLLAILVFALHVGPRWPNGTLEVTLALTFALVSLSGVVGLLLSRWIPPRLSMLEHHEELIFERIPGAIHQLRERVEELVLESLDAGRSTAIAEYYQKRMVDHFTGPRNLLHHVVGSRAHARRMAVELAEFRSCLDDSEREHFGHVERALWVKDDLDLQFACQGILKLWLFVHIPATVCLVLFALCHLILVYAYGAA